ncbi:DEAD/DEAH box helicase [Terrilactibacillus laevilacticus]|uniref:DEAD/DEAH box helicase n=1 Tax=Terrilactibacillus laevilacticus TaxID=1380157 RepID=A0ABW5PUI6_9BACI|nr:SNF2-related protein [Terrilactibacillus laevilacticus]
MERYLFALNRELFDLQAMEMDVGLIHFFKQMDIADDVFEMENDKGLRRKFSINWEEELLQGRGIKGFFAHYSSEWLTIEFTEDKGITVVAPDIPPSEPLVSEYHNTEHTKKVVDSIVGFTSIPDKWFQLYQIAQLFKVGAKQEELVCLPYVREIEPFEYQTNTVKSVINRFKGRVLLSDEVGLGKTVEAGMTMLEYIMRGLVRKILILVPSSLVGQWENEMKRKFNQDFIRADDPDFKKMGDEAWGHYPKVIASIDMAKRKNYREAITAQQFDLVIVDEAHHLKNRATQKWQFVNAINKKYIFLLTATPVQNHLEELYNLITLLKPGQLRTYRYFKKNFVESRDGIEVKNADILKNLLADVMIRNKRSNVDVTFTKRFAHTRTVILSDQEKQLYDDISTFIRNHYKEQHPVLNRFQLKSLQEQIGSSTMAIIPSLERLYANEKLSSFDRKVMKRFLDRANTIAQNETETNAKVEELLSILREFGDKMIIFTKYATTQAYLSRLLRNHGLHVAEFHGGLRRKEKEEQVAFFKEKADVLVSTEVGGEGRNLQFCHGMINFDLPWNPMAIEQRIGRIHRIGQEKDVFVYNLASKDTIEYYILDLLDRKINMFELVVGKVDAILGDLEEKEDFSELVMNAWANAETTEEVQSELDQIGQVLLENKQKWKKQKDLDNDLF